MNFATRSCEQLDLVRCELQEDLKSGASCKKNQSQMRAKIEVNAIFVKFLCSDTCNGLLEVEQRVMPDAY